MFIVLASLLMKFDFFWNPFDYIEKNWEIVWCWLLCCVVFEYGLSAIWGLMNSNVDEFSFFVDKIW